MFLPRRAARIICVGHTALDRVFRVRGWPSGGAKVRAQSFRETGGGMAANAAATIVRLGGEALFWGPAGDDALADLMADELRALGVDASGLKRIAGTQSSHSAILVDDRGERLIVGARGGGLTCDADWLPIEGVATAQALLADVRWPAGALRALSEARRRGVPSILDGDVAERSTLEALAHTTDYAIFSSAGLAVLSGMEVNEDSDARALTDALEVALALGPRVALVTRGAVGVAWCARERPGVLARLPAFPIERVTDTTGAGDVFHGAFALRIGEGECLSEAIRFASVAAGLKCAYEGARAPVARAQVDAALAQWNEPISNEQP